VIRSLKERGCSGSSTFPQIEEIFEVGDRVSVSATARWFTHADQGDRPARTDTEDGGARARKRIPARRAGAGERDTPDREPRSTGYSNVNLTLYRGEVLGLGRTAWSGKVRTRKARVRADSKEGRADISDGREIAPESPYQAIRRGIGLLTEDRNRYGLIMQCPSERTSLLPTSARCSRPVHRPGKEEAAAKQLAEDLRIKAPGTGVIVETLSGGTGRKSSWPDGSTQTPGFLIFDEPTAGIDVGVKFEIYTLINRLAERGIGVIVILLRPPRAPRHLPRVAVMCEGRLTGVVEGAEATQEAVMTYAHKNR